MRTLPLLTLLLATTVVSPMANAQQLRQPPGQPSTLPSRGGPGTPTPITRFTPLQLDIHFDDASLFEIINDDETLRAELRLLSDGAGLFIGAWEVSEPGFSGFRPLSQIRIASAGRQMRKLISPVLPNARPGLYEVRFRPSSGMPTKAIRYSVVPNQSQDRPEVALLSPLPEGRILPKTPFRWSSVPGAATYQLQILGGRERLVAVDVDDTSAQLRPPALERLRDYVGPMNWRVIAVDGEGYVLGVAASQTIGSEPVQ